MKTATEKTTNWERECFSQQEQFREVNSIATETQELEDPAWAQCIDTLLGALSIAQDTPDDPDSPTRAALVASLQWLVFLRALSASSPLSCIIPGPDGGMILERRTRYGQDQEHVMEIEIDSDGKTELTVYLGGKVFQTVQFVSPPEC